MVLNKKFPSVLGSTFFFLSTEQFREQALFLMYETANGYSDLLDMPTDMRIDLIRKIMDIKQIQKEKREQLERDLKMPKGKSTVSRPPK